MEVFEITAKIGDADYNQKLYEAKGNVKNHLVQYAIWYLQDIVEPMDDLAIVEAGLTRKKVDKFKNFLQWIISKRANNNMPKGKLIKARYNEVSPEVKKFFKDFDVEMKAVEEVLQMKSVKK